MAIPLAHRNVHEHLKVIPAAALETPMVRSMQVLMTLAQHVLVAAAYSLCVAIVAGATPGLIAGAALFALLLFRERDLIGPIVADNHGHGSQIDPAQLILAS